MAHIIIALVINVLHVYVTHVNMSEALWTNGAYRYHKCKSIWLNPLNGEDCWKGIFDDKRWFGSDKSRSETFFFCWNYFKIDTFKLWFMSHKTLNLKGKKNPICQELSYTKHSCYTILLETKEKTRHFKNTRCFMWSIFTRILIEKGCCSVTRQSMCKQIPREYKGWYTEWNS